MPRAIVLGCGMVGSMMIADLARDDSFEVAVADNRPDVLERAAARCPRKVKTITADLADPAVLTKVIAPYDVVLGALSSAIGLSALRAVIEAGKNYCDISFMPEDPLGLDALAKRKGVTAVVDCGVAPGMSHMLAGYATTLLDRCERLSIMVGGLPRERRWPFEYKAGFSPADVLEEYTRPARFVEHGKEITREALSDAELVDLPGVGTLEAFLTDGLRSLATTLPIPFMVEKTLRYPGHAELMRVLRAMGLFSQETIDVKGVKVRPIDVVSKLMFPMWSYEQGEEDLTVMRVAVEGERQGEQRRLVWDLFDLYDRGDHRTSMARTTALPCTIVARMLASGELRSPGVIVPERLGQTPGICGRVLKELEQRGVRYHFSDRATA